jgi:hypothetical protein
MVYPVIGKKHQQAPHARPGHTPDDVIRLFNARGSQLSKRIPSMLFIPRILLFLSLSLAVSGERIVRFISTDGKEYYGDAILPAGTTDAAKSTSARVIHGDILGDFTVTKQVKVCTINSFVVSSPYPTQKIKKLLAPLPSERVHTVRMVGLNYVAHINETNGTIPGWLHSLSRLELQCF